MPDYFRRWTVFCRERFPLLRHVVLIAFYVAANALVALRSADASPVPATKFGLCFCVILAVFLHLRIFDEIKDYRTDLAVHKDRPLARGLITVGEAKRTAFGLIAVELTLAALTGAPAFVAAAVTVGYSLVMYKEFFAGDWLRPKMATYALTHTLVSCWMSLVVFSSVTGLMFWTAPGLYGWFVLVNWMIFNIFEFGRKTFGREEEQELVESYSKRLGPVRASLNVVIMASVAVVVAGYLGHALRLHFLYDFAVLILFGLTLTAAGLYAVHNDAKTGRLFRGICSVFILFYNVIVTAGILTAGGAAWTR